MPTALNHQLYGAIARKRPHVVAATAGHTSLRTTRALAQSFSYLEGGDSSQPHVVIPVILTLPPLASPRGGRNQPHVATSTSLPASTPYQILAASAKGAKLRKPPPARPVGQSEAQLSLFFASHEPYLRAAHVTRTSLHVAHRLGCDLVQVFGVYPCGGSTRPRFVVRGHSLQYHRDRVRGVEHV